MVFTLMSVTAPIAVARLVFKKYFSANQRLNSEDWTIVALAPFGFSTVVLTTYGLTRNGLGVDAWGLEQDQVIAFGHYFYVVQMLYIILIALVKLTLTFFYLNIFTGSIVRKFLWLLVATHVLTAVGFVIAIVFQCVPISYQWTKYDVSNGHPVSGQCNNINAAGWVHGALGVALDLWLMAIPLSQIHKLKLPWRKRLCVALMFMTGSM